MIFFEGTEAEAAKRFTAYELQIVVCRWKTDKDRRRYYLCLTAVCIIAAVFLVLGTLFWYYVYLHLTNPHQ